MTRRVGVVIPCYRAAGQVGPVVQEVLQVGETLRAVYSLQVFVVSDASPELSWQDLQGQANVQVVHHGSNQGVGAASITAGLIQSSDASRFRLLSRHRQQCRDVMHHRLQALPD